MLDNIKEKLAFLYLDLPPFPVTSSLIQRLETIVKESSFDDQFRNCRHIPIYVSAGKDIRNNNLIEKQWSKESEQLPEIKNYIETYVKPWTNELGRIVVICTKAGESNPTHIDCSRKNFDKQMLEHKFRVVLRGQTDNLYFNGQNINYHIKENLINQPFVMSGYWPHSMSNNNSDMKFTLAMGAPWTVEDHNAKYDQLLDNSIKKYENSYISKLDMTMPEDIESYFSK
jgi:hypothetical protein